MKTIPHSSLSRQRFAPYGSIFSLAGSGPLAETRAFSYWNDLARFRIEGETEIGWCVVRAHDDPIDWMERHDRTPEILIPARAPIVLPVMSAMNEVEAFLIEPDQVVVIDSGVWHSACLPADGDEAGYFVIFRRGTPASDVVKMEIDGFRVGGNGTR
jgi:ureidoglycolate hydrolase